MNLSILVPPSNGRTDENQALVQRILKGDPNAREQFLERYTNIILKGLLRKCKRNCTNLACPIRYGVTQSNLEKTCCDELENLYLFSLESIFKALKSYRNDKSLDEWMEHQTNPNGIFFRQRFAAYMALKYPLTGRARVPDRFQNVWSSIQKNIYKFWLRQQTALDMASKLRLPESEVMEMLEDILDQLKEAGLLVSLREGVQLESFQQRERNVYESTQPYTTLEQDIDKYETDSFESLETIPQTQPETLDDLLIKTLQHGVAAALSNLNRQEHRLLMLKFDSEYTLKEISEQCDMLGLEKMTEKQVGHAIDAILRKMLPVINQAIAEIDDVDLKLPGLKQVLLEWGTQNVNKVHE